MTADDRHLGPAVAGRGQADLAAILSELGGDVARPDPLWGVI
jgi:hypothetical protein